jgi:hypothetical protein
MLFRSVCALGAGVHHGFIPRIEFEDAFLAACNHNGLLGREGRRAILATINSGLSYAENDPLPDLEEQRKQSRKRNSDEARKRKKPNGDANGGGGGDDALPDPPDDASEAQEPDSDGNRPAIQVSPGSLSDNASEAENALLAANVEIYRQRGILVRPLRLTARDNKRNAVQVPALANVTTAFLRDTCSRHIRWEKYDGRSKKNVPTNPATATVLISLR